MEIIPALENFLAEEIAKHEATVGSRLLEKIDQAGLGACVRAALRTTQWVANGVQTQWLGSDLPAWQRRIIAPILKHPQLSAGRRAATRNVLDSEHPTPTGTKRVPQATVYLWINKAEGATTRALKPTRPRREAMARAKDGPVPLYRIKEETSEALIDAELAEVVMIGEERNMQLTDAGRQWAEQHEVL